MSHMQLRIAMDFSWSLKIVLIISVFHCFGFAMLEDMSEISSSESLNNVTTTQITKYNLAGNCYKKSYGKNSNLTTCSRGPYGCYEIERLRYYYESDIKMGCLRNPCKTLRRTNVIRQCCNTSLCNNLHERDSLFLPSPLPTFPPRPLPPLPTVNPTLLEIDGGLLCVSPAHPPYEACLSPYGCYRLYDALTLEVLNLTCIESPDFKLCAREYVVFDDRFAECCYDHHYCNEHRKIATPPPPTHTPETTSAPIYLSTNSETKSTTPNSVHTTEAGSFQTTKMSNTQTTEMGSTQTRHLLPLSYEIICVDSTTTWCSTMYGCVSLWNTTGDLFHQTCLRRKADLQFCSHPFFEFDGPKVGDCCQWSFCNVNPIFPSIVPSTEPITEVTDPPTMDPSLPAKRCYQKGVEESTPTFCIAGQHGCFETERHSDSKPTEIEMGCLQSPCKPIKEDNKIHQCCNTSLCNNLHERDPLFLPSLLPTLPPRPLPPLPTVNPTLLEIDGGLLCVSPAHPPHQECLSPYGCYTLYNSTTIEVINQTCIEISDFRLCLKESEVYNETFAECCYDYHHCNNKDRTVEPSRGKRDVNNEQVATKYLYDSDNHPLSRMLLAFSTSLVLFLMSLLIAVIVMVLYFRTFSKCSLPVRRQCEDQKTVVAV